VQRYYASNYLNVYDSHRKTSILFNGFTGAIDEVTQDLGKVLHKAARSREPLSTAEVSAITKPAIEFLKRRGHVTTIGPEKEIELFVNYTKKLHQHITGAFEKEGSLMIVPSYNCNLACSYCYQSMLRNGARKKAKIMTPEQVDFIFTRLIEQVFPNVSDKARISIMLYGGEPFMLLHRPVLRRIIKYTKKYQMRVSAITNTTQVHNMMELFGNEIGLVNSVQSSFDGSKENHDKSRVNVRKAPTFERIIENIHKLLDKRVRVGIRINVDKNSILTLPRLVERLKKEDILEHPLVHVYAWMIHSHYGQIESDSLVLPLELTEYIEANHIPIETPVGRCERRLKAVFDATEGNPLRRTAFCMKHLPNSFVFDADGNLYDCYEEAGHPEKRVGYVNQSGRVVLESPQREMDIERHVAAIEECRSCSLALTCGGGCSFSAKARTGTIYAADCNYHKECVEKAVGNLFRKKVESMENHLGIEKSEDLYPYA